MKKLLLMSLLGMIYLSTKAQQRPLLDSIPTQNGNFEYQEVVKVDTSLTKDILYSNANRYFIEFYKSAKDVIQYENAAEGKLLGKGFFTVTELYDGMVKIPFELQVNYTTEIIAKNGRYRYRFYNIHPVQIGKYGASKPLELDELIRQSNKGTYKVVMTKLLKSTMANFRNNQAQLKAYMIGKQVTSASDNF